mgnify:CR=1 FL=1
MARKPGPAGGKNGNAKNKSNTGRKSTYDPARYPTLAWWLCQKDGMTDDELAKAFSVAKSTISEWKKKYPEFSEAIKKGKELSNSLVVKSLFDSCFDHTVVEGKRIKKKDKNGEEIILIEEYKRVIPANTLAQQIWLYNRCPDSWRRNPDPERGNKTKDPLDVYLDGLKDNDDEQPNKSDTVSETD